MIFDALLACNVDDGSFTLHAHHSRDAGVLFKFPAFSSITEA